MAKYCRKCGKELIIKNKQVFDPNTGEAQTEVAGRRCPSRAGKWLSIFSFIDESHDEYDSAGRLYYA